MSTSANDIAPVNAQIAAGMPNEFLTFTLGAEEYGVAILRVQCIQVWEDATPIPGAPPWVLGVTNLRGVYWEVERDTLIAIPLFILAGALMNTVCISTRLIAFVSSLIGFVRGGLAMVNVGVSMFFAEISGSAVAVVAAIAAVGVHAAGPALSGTGFHARELATLAEAVRPGLGDLDGPPLATWIGRALWLTGPSLLAVRVLDLPLQCGDPCFHRLHFTVLGARVLLRRRR